MVICSQTIGIRLTKLAVTKSLLFLRRDFCFSGDREIYIIDTQVFLERGVNSRYLSQIQAHISHYSFFSKLEDLWYLEPRVCLPLPLTTLLPRRGSASLLRILPNPHPESAQPKVQEVVCQGLGYCIIPNMLRWTQYESLSTHMARQPQSFLPSRAENFRHIHPGFQTIAKFGKQQVIWM